MKKVSTEILIVLAILTLVFASSYAYDKNNSYEFWEGERISKEDMNKLEENLGSPFLLCSFKNNNCIRIWSLKDG